MTFVEHFLAVRALGLIVGVDDLSDTLATVFYMVVARDGLEADQGGEMSRGERFEESPFQSLKTLMKYQEREHNKTYYSFCLEPQAI